MSWRRLVGLAREGRCWRGKVLAREGAHERSLEASGRLIRDADRRTASCLVP